MLHRFTVSGEDYDTIRSLTKVLVLMQGIRVGSIETDTGEGTRYHFTFPVAVIVGEWWAQALMYHRSILDSGAITEEDLRLAFTGELLEAEAALTSNRLHVIKVIRARTGCGLHEAKDYIEIVMSQKS